MHASPPPLSVVVIARDESRTLPRLLVDLEEFRERGGEVVLVDTGSRDDTAAVARAAGCRVVEVGARFESALDEADARRIEERFRHPDDPPLARGGERVFDFAAAREHASGCASNPWVFHVDAGDTLEALDLDFVEETIRGGGYARIEHGLKYGSLSLRLTRIYDHRRAGWRGRVHEELVPRSFDDPGVIRSSDDRQVLVTHLQDPA
jgi:glycosyltransferase involved in cell wall biosynthesis